MFGQHGDLLGDVHRAVAEGWPLREHQVAQARIREIAEVGAPVPDRRQPLLTEVQQHTDAVRPQMEIRLFEGLRPLDRVGLLDRLSPQCVD